MNLKGIYILPPAFVESDQLSLTDHLTNTTTCDALDVKNNHKQTNIDYNNDAEHLLKLSQKANINRADDILLLSIIRSKMIDHISAQKSLDEKQTKVLIDLLYKHQPPQRYKWSDQEKEYINTVYKGLD